MDQILLMSFVEQVVTKHKVVHICSHETTICIIRSANNRLSPDIKTGIYKNTAAGLFFKFIQKLPVPLICIPVNALDPG